MDELIVDYSTIKSRLDNYSEYLTELEDTLNKVRSGSLSTTGDYKINELTGILKGKIEIIQQSCELLGSTLNEYLDDFSKAEGELANQKAGVFNLPPYNGEIAQVVNSAIIPVLRGERPSLKLLGYKYKTGADWNIPIRSPYWWEDPDGECTCRAWLDLANHGIYWDKPCSNARNWAEEWEKAGGETYPLYYENGVIQNTDRVGANDILCCNYYGKSEAADRCGHVIYVGVDDNGKYYISHAGHNMRHKVRGGYDTFEDLLADDSYWDIRTLKDEIDKGNVTVLSISGPSGN